MPWLTSQTLPVNPVLTVGRACRGAKPIETATELASALAPPVPCPSRVDLRPSELPLDPAVVPPRRLSRRRVLSPTTRSNAVITLAVLTCAAWLTSAADPPVVVELWPGGAPEEGGTIGPERTRLSPKLDRQQVEVTEQTRLITDVTKPTLTVCRPSKVENTGTAVIICPGGGYWDLYWQLEGEEVAAWLNSIGVTGILLKYRVPRRPDEPQGEPARRPLQDAQRAVRLVRSKAGEWGLQASRIGMVGFSAGGHLVIATATSFEKRTYEPGDAVDAASCRPDFAIAVYPGYLKPKDKDELAPGLQVPPATPPVFLAHGGADVISPPEHSVLMYLALRRAGIPAELHVYAGAAHDFGVRASDQPCATWTMACAAWLRHQGFLAPLAQR
jgi:acetyl esterase/lipase